MQSFKYGFVSIACSKRTGSQEVRATESNQKHVRGASYDTNDGAIEVNTSISPIELFGERLPS
jgi:hypothetical protein